MEVEIVEVSLFGKVVQTRLGLDGDGMPRAQMGGFDLTGTNLTAEQLRDIAALLERYADDLDRLEGLNG